MLTQFKDCNLIFISKLKNEQNPGLGLDGLGLATNNNVLTVTLNSGDSFPRVWSNIISL